MSIDTPTGDQEHTRFGRLPALAELERFFLLDDADHALVARRRGDHNRLGFALQLGTVRYRCPRGNRAKLAENASTNGG